MRIKIFDDKRSIVHFIAGFLTPLLKPLLIIYLFYELIEYCYRKDNLAGDLIEYLLGVSFYTLLSLVM